MTSIVYFSLLASKSVHDIFVSLGSTEPDISIAVVKFHNAGCRGLLLIAICLPGLLVWSTH